MPAHIQTTLDDINDLLKHLLEVDADLEGVINGSSKRFADFVDNNGDRIYLDLEEGYKQDVLDKLRQIRQFMEDNTITYLKRSADNLEQALGEHL